MESIYQSKHLKRAYYKTPLTEEKQLIVELEKRSDTEANRLKRYMALSDLTRIEGHPLKAVIDLVINIPNFKQFDIIRTNNDFF